MRILTYIKSLNETALMALIAMIVFFPTIFWLTGHKTIDKEPDVIQKDANPIDVLAIPDSKEISDYLYGENVSKLPRNYLEMNDGYKIFLMSEDEEIRTVPEGDYLCGYDIGHPVYEGKYKIVSVKNGKIISSYNLNYDEYTWFFTDNKPHNGINKFIEPRTEKELVTIYQYASCNDESVSFFRLDENGVIKLVNFYTNLLMNYNPDINQNKLPYFETNYNGSIYSIYNTGTGEKASIGFCLYNNAEENTHCETFEYKNENFYSVNVKTIDSRFPP